MNNKIVQIIPSPADMWAVFAKEETEPMSEGGVCRVACLICKGRFKRVEDMEPALQTLVNMGHVREIEIATGGRPTKKLLVNPKSKSSKSSKKA